ncbi:prolipoprotein diacylglyceryl transferase [Exilibacterium tricleocarpae]|uniref:Phosphatidylglycerol--prolipoprotein diacylglyceryl transferase n=1 Tax=Exilibacterium tricleocarpae TaxID=2591008 RepID=A0A545TKD9_9GAMM|nr:prolipoprotein diacylglyceryl transferase [Exilibacterium tricleocarpae]TQV77631.1 prolipoprotein diacylglyceryl transferase [Exilibacterium tricleocarpae]
MKYPNIDPVAVSIGPFNLGDRVIGPLDIHWYGLMYLLGFIGAWLLALKRAQNKYSPIQKSQVEDLIVYCALGVILGGRCGYVIFYHFEEWLGDPLWLFRVWEGGMSFHGGLIGVLVAMWLYARRLKQHPLDVLDFVAPLVPLGLGLGRIGNFIGGELWGRETTLSWGMQFPKDELGLLRHPSQLYQAFLEGLVLFVVLFWFSSKPRPRATVGGLFLALYGCFRFLVEFVREPDSHLQDQLLFDWMTRGQVLSLPMIVAGIGLTVWGYRYRRYVPARSERASG